MLEVLLFSFSVSIDAIGLSLNFGSRNFILTKMQFLALNILNSAVLTFFLMIFPFVPFMNVPWIGSVGSYAMLIIGEWYIVKCICCEINAFYSPTKKKHNLSFVKRYFSLKEFFLLVFFFVVENVMSTIIFYSSLMYPVLFIVSTFIFHHMAFTIGYDLGDKLSKVLPFDPNFISGIVFFALGILNINE